MMRFYPFLALFFTVSLFSCKSQHTVIKNYLQHLDTSSKTYLNLTEPKIQKNDLLSIKVYSQTADPRTDVPYNLPEQTVVGSSTTSATAGFLVDENGNIEYPQLGTLHVAGLTKSEVAQEIKTKLGNVLKNPSVIVRFLNYRVTVLGEVRSPGTFNIPTERVTLLEALGLAGDITDFGKRDTVKIAREVNGQMEFGYVNLAAGDLFQSPYYRLQQNDVVFVEQNRRKEEQLTMQQQQVTAQRIGIISSVVSVLAIVYSLIRR